MSDKNVLIFATLVVARSVAPSAPPSACTDLTHIKSSMRVIALTIQRVAEKRFGSASCQTGEHCFSHPVALMPSTVSRMVKSAKKLDRRKPLRYLICVDDIDTYKITERFYAGIT